MISSGWNAIAAQTRLGSMGGIAEGDDAEMVSSHRARAELADALALRGARGAEWHRTRAQHPALLGTLAVLPALELQALNALLVPLGAHAPRTGDRTHPNNTYTMTARMRQTQRVGARGG